MIWISNSVKNEQKYGCNQCEYQYGMLRIEWLYLGSMTFKKLFYGLLPSSYVMGIIFMTGVLEITFDVRSKPLGQKRKRWIPKKLLVCLTRSQGPEPQVVGDIPNACSLYKYFPDLIHLIIPSSQCCGHYSSSSTTSTANISNIDISN